MGEQCCVPTSILPVLTIFSTQGVPIQIGEKRSVLKGWCTQNRKDGVLKTVKPPSMDRRTLFILNGSHLSYVVEEVEPG